jgi:hypothetical protein
MKLSKNITLDKNFSNGFVVRFSLLALLLCGLVGGASATSFTVDGASGENNGDSTSTNQRGNVFSLSENFKLQYVTVMDALDGSGHTLRLYNNDTGNKLAETTISNDKADFGGVQLDSGETYIITKRLSGGVHYFDNEIANLPQQKTGITFESSIICDSSCSLSSRSYFQGSNSFINNWYSIELTQNNPPQFNSSSITPDPPLIGESVSYAAEVFDSDGSVDYTNLTLSYKGSTVLSDVQRTGTTPEWNDVFTPQTGNKWLNATLEVVDDSGAVTEKEINRYLTDNPPNISLNKPVNKTYGTNDVPYNITVLDDADSVPDERLSCDLKNDGSPFTTVTLTEGGSDETGSFYANDGSHSFKASCVENDGDSNTGSVTVDFSVDTTKPDLDLIYPDNSTFTNSTSGINLNYTVSDPNLDSSSCKYSKDGGANFSISNCENTSISFGSIGTHNLSLYASDSLNNTAFEFSSFKVDNLNKVTVDEAISEASINDFTLTLSNSSDTLVKTTSKGYVNLYTSEMPKGDVNATVESSGFQTKTKEFSSVDDAFDQDLNFDLERAGFDISVLNEDINTKLNEPVEIELRNDTAIQTFVWGNKYSSSRIKSSTEPNPKPGFPAKIENPSFAFDTDKDTKALVDQENLASSDEESVYEINGFVSLNEGMNNLSIILETSATAKLKSFQMEKNGGFVQKFSVQQTNDYNLGNKRTVNLNINNSDNSYSGKVKLLFLNEYADGYGSEFRLYEVYANNLISPSLEYPNYPTGKNVRINVDDNNPNDLFRPRTFYADLTENSKVNLDAFLLKRGKGIQTSVEVRDGQNDALPGTDINVQRNYGSGYRTVAQVVTSSGGSTSFYLSPDIPYRVVASQQGFDSFQGTFNPANYQYDPLLIRLGEDNNFRESTTWDSVEYRLRPEQSSLNLTSKYSFNWSIIDSENGVSSYGIKVKNSSGAIVESKALSGSPSGGSVELSFNASKNGFQPGQSLTVSGFFVKDQTEFQFEREYNLINRVEPGIFSVKTLMGSFGSKSSGLAQSMIALIFTLVIGSGLKSRFNNAGAGIVSMMVLGLFTLQGWFPALIWTFTALALIGLYGRSA